MNDDNELIRKIQLKELEILKVFQEICKRHNLRYFAIGGTCLGAVRHKGFIPWDDDVDVAMPYEDWKKFLELADSELPENYGIINPRDMKHCIFHMFCKIQDKNTTFIENVCMDYPDRYSGVFIDVFPVHGLPESKSERKRVSFLSTVYCKLDPKLRLGIDKTPSWKGAALWLVSSPLRLFLPFNYFYLKHEKMISKYPFGCSDTIMFPWRQNKSNSKGWYKNRFPYEDFKTTVELPFEDTTISVPVGYERYMTMEFGDYMTLPPEENRRNHSKGSIIDLERPYTYYVQQKEAGKLCS